MTEENYPRGFVLGGNPSSRPAGFVESNLLPGLFVDPLNEIRSAYDAHSKNAVIVIGTCRSLNGDPSDVAPRLLRELSASSSKGFFNALDALVGRFVVIYREGGVLRVVTDATAMRPVFFSEGGGAIASHAKLLAGSQGKADTLPFASSFPANFTPYKGVRILLPNFVLDFETGALERFWPRQAIEPRSVEKTAHKVLTLSTRSISVLARDRISWMAVTAGLDSRVLLAVALNAGVDFTAFTYGQNAGTLVDREIAKMLARQFDFTHRELPTAKPNKDLGAALSNSHYWDHHWSAVGPLRAAIGNPEAAVFTANILEIGQSNFRKLDWNAGAEEPRTAEQMAFVYFRKLSKRAKDQVRNYGHQRYMGEVTAYFQRMIDETGGTTEFLDPFDEYYWNIRMGTWHGPNTVEKDFYGEPLNPFNSRSIIEPLISVSKLDQYDLSVFLRLITLVDPRLLELPINPANLKGL